MAHRERRDREDLDDQLTGLAERLERTEMESETLREAWQEARKEVEFYKSKASGIEARYKAAEEAREQQHEESQKHLAMLDEVTKKANRLKGEANKRANVISGLQTDLSSSVGRTQSLENQLGGLKKAFSKVASQLKSQSYQKTDTARMLIDQMIKLHQLERQEDSEIPEQSKWPDIWANEREHEEENGESIPIVNPGSECGPNWQLLEDESPTIERRGPPSEPDFFGSSLEKELEEAEQRRNLDDSLKLTGNESQSSLHSDLFSPKTEQDDSAAATDLDDDDDDRGLFPSRMPPKLFGSELDGGPDFSGLKPNPSVYKRQEHPEFRLDLLEQAGPRKRARIRQIQDNTVVKEPDPWKGSQKSRIPVALVKDISRLTLQDKSGKTTTKPSTTQVKSILKLIPGNPHLERFKAHRPDRFKRSKRDKPPAGHPSAPVEYTVMVDPAMAEDTNMFGTQTPVNKPLARQPASQPTQTIQNNPCSIHGNMFAPEVLAPPVAAAPTNANTATSNDNATSRNGPLLHYGPSTSSKRPVAEPVRKYKSFGPPIKNSPKLPRIVRNNYPGAVYRPTPYGQDSTRLDLPWAAWMTQARAPKQEQASSTSAQAQPSWGDFDFFQRGADSMDLLPERQSVLLKWRIALMCMGVLFFLWLTLNNGRSINDRDLWLDANDIPRSVLMQIRGQPTYSPQWLDILEYKLIKWAGIDRVALG